MFCQGSWPNFNDEEKNKYVKYKDSNNTTDPTFAAVIKMQS